jgi:ribonucleoside-diphosphate reductase alpha chain
MTLQTHQQVKKREGQIVSFDNFKIQNAIYKALLDVNTPEALHLSGALTDLVLSKINSDTIDIEKIQDIVEMTLLEEKHVEAARHYMLYRDEKRKIREEKKKILQKDTLDDVDKSFSINQLRVLAERYLLRDLKTNKIIESPSEMFRRVATLIGLSDLLHDPSLFNKEGSGNDFPELAAPTYDEYFKTLDERFINPHHFNRFVALYQELDQQGQMRKSLRTILDDLFVPLFDSKYEKNIQEYYDLMISCTFMPNTPTLMNAGTANGGLSACFVLDAKDSVDSYIRDTVGDAASIFRAAGGVGINFSKFRPEGSEANGVPNAASGPCSFIQMINTLTDVIKAGGKRRGANMGVLDISHPDAEHFITMKSTPGVLENFNVSVGVWDEYWGALTSEKMLVELSHPTHSEKNKMINPQHLWDLIALSAWKSAEPGVLFFDNVNKVNHMKNEIGLLNVVNPCGEQFLDYNNSCTLGSINVSKFVDPETKQFDWFMFQHTVRVTTRFLDNVLDMNKYPTEKISRTSKNLRRIGLGVMGVADALYMMDIPYNSKDGFQFMSDICGSMTASSIEKSIEIAKERGPFPFYNYQNHGIDINNIRTSSSLHIRQIQDEIHRFGIRNAWNTTVAPTGTISMIAGCSSGIEPEFALAYEKKVTIGSFVFTNKYLAEALKREGLYSDELLKKIADNGGSIQSIEEIPDYIKNVFVTAMDIHWADHVMAQAACQQYIDNSISKTVNMANDVLVDDIKNAYLLAHELGCKGLSVYRDGSRHTQVLHTNSEKTGKQLKPSQYVLDYIKSHINNQYIIERLGVLFDSDKMVGEITHAPHLPETTKQEDKYISPVSNIQTNCPLCHSAIIFKEGCVKCVFCSWAACSSS